MAENISLQKIADMYDENPIVRALVQVAMAPIPYGIGSAIDSALTAKIESMREERLRVFFNELASGIRDLTEDLIQEEDFLHAYFSTLKAAVNTSKKGKVRLFARLLLTATKEKRIGDDTYEEFLKILDELSMRELHILVILKRYEDSHPQVILNEEAENDMQRAMQFWSDFEAEINNQYNLSAKELRAILNRLNRTGLYETFAGYWDDDGGKGKLTPVFSQFTNWIQTQNDDFNATGKE